MSKDTTTIVKDSKMELNRMSVSIISVLVTLAISFGGFMYQLGQFRNEIQNIKENQIVIKTDLQKDIDKMDENKAEKDLVTLLFQKIEGISEKLDRLIENKISKDIK